MEQSQVELRNLARRTLFSLIKKLDSKEGNKYLAIYRRTKSKRIRNKYISKLVYLSEKHYSYSDIMNEMFKREGKDAEVFNKGMEVYNINAEYCKFRKTIDYRHYKNHLTNEQYTDILFILFNDIDDDTDVFDNLDTYKINLENARKKYKEYIKNIPDVEEEVNLDELHQAFKSLSEFTDKYIIEGK